jgi:nucleotide-binding universal stress UspA family protein
MPARLLHIFRNTPFGRETLLASIHFSRTTGAELSVYLPRDKKFLLYFEYGAVQVDLDSSYLDSPETAENNLRGILEAEGVKAEIFEARHYSASTLPDVPSDVEFMTCPRVIADVSSKIALGRIGSKVRAILKQAPFPVLIPSGVFKPWRSICVLFGGSENGLKALHLGLNMARNCGVPLDLFTQADDTPDNYRARVAEAGLEAPLTRHLRTWEMAEDGDFARNLYCVPHDALVVVGAYGHGLIKDVLFGSTMETVQTTLPNNLLIVGPNFVRHPWYEPASSS